MGTLYEMTQQAETLYQLMIAEEIDEQTFNDTIAAMGIVEKIEAYCNVINKLKSDVDFYSDRIKSIQAHKQTATNRIDTMKQLLLNAMNTLGQSKVDAGEYKVTVKVTKSPKYDNKMIPEQYFIPVEPKLDKDAVKNDVAKGIDVPGFYYEETRGVMIR